MKTCLSLLLRQSTEGHVDEQKRDNFHSDVFTELIPLEDGLWGVITSRDDLPLLNGVF